MIARFETFRWTDKKNFGVKYNYESNFNISHIRLIKV